MHVGIITYQTGHLKTWQILKKLLTKPYAVSLYAFPFVKRPQTETPFPDRPNQLIDFDMEGFCKDHRIRYVKLDGWEDQHAPLFGMEADPKPPDVFLTCIAKIIPASFISGRIIINAHPGLLPENRGVDAFKRAIINGWPIGASIHVIDEVIDRGTLLHRMRIPVFTDDTFQDVARRAYEMECELQANFEDYLSGMHKTMRIADRYPLNKEQISKALSRRIDVIFERNKGRLMALSRGAGCTGAAMW